MRHLAWIGLVLAGCSSSSNTVAPDACGGSFMTYPVDPAWGACDTSHDGVTRCVGSTGFGYTCRAGCWSGFFDGPCWPGEAGTPPVDASLDTGR